MLREGLLRGVPGMLLESPPAKFTATFMKYSSPSKLTESVLRCPRRALFPSPGLLGELERGESVR